MGDRNSCLPSLLVISLTAQGLAKHWSSHLLIYVCAHVRAMWKSGDSLWQRAWEPFPPLGDVASRVQGSSNMHQGPGSAGYQPPSHVFSYYFLFGNIPISTLNSTCKVLLLGFFFFKKRKSPPLFYEINHIRLPLSRFHQC